MGAQKVWGLGLHARSLMAEKGRPQGRQFCLNLEPQPVPIHPTSHSEPEAGGHPQLEGMKLRAERQN